MSLDFLTQQLVEGVSNGGQVGYKFSIIVDKAKEGSQLLYISRSWSLGNSSYLVGGCVQSVCITDISKVFH